MQFKLAEIFILQMGKTPGRENDDYWTNGIVKWISIADLSKCDKYIINTAECITELAVAESGIKLIPADTVIMSFKLSIGKLAITPKPMYSNEAIMAFIDKGIVKIEPSYLYYLFMQKDWDEGTNKAVMGKTLNKATLSSMSINIHDYDKQLVISRVLDKVRTVITMHKYQLEELDNLIKSRFVEMFGKEKYRMVKSKDVCDFITKGTTPKTNEIVEDYAEGFIPYLKVYNLSFDGKMQFDVKPQFIAPEIHRGGLARSKVYPNDVLMNIVGPPLGKFAFVPDTYQEWNINQAIAIFRATDKVIPRFLLHALMQPKVLQPFIDSAVGIRQQNLSLEQCRNLKIPLPPLDMQNQFTTFVQQVDKLKVICA